MMTIAKRLQSLDQTLTYSIQQLELKSFDYNERIATLEVANKEGLTPKEMVEIIARNPEQVF